MFLELLLGSLYVNELQQQTLGASLENENESTSIEITIDLGDVQSLRDDAQDRRNEPDTD